MSKKWGPDVKKWHPGGGPKNEKNAPCYDFFRVGGQKKVKFLKHETQILMGGVPETSKIVKKVGSRDDAKKSIWGSIFHILMEKRKGDYLDGDKSDPDPPKFALGGYEKTVGNSSPTLTFRKKRKKPKKTCERTEKTAIFDLCFVPKFAKKHQNQAQISGNGPRTQTRKVFFPWNLRKRRPIG